MVFHEYLGVVPRQFLTTCFGFAFQRDICAVPGLVCSITVLVDGCLLWVACGCHCRLNSAGSPSDLGKDRSQNRVGLALLLRISNIEQGWEANSTMPITW